MAGNDISSLIQDIYDRYKENQKDKKPEEQMYMSEEEFKANLKSMVNKSDIEDKFMLYNEIYLHITEDALEIDTTGNITISPKVIVNAEKEVIRRLEEHKNVENSKIGITEVVVGKTILDMTKEEYDKLSVEQRKEVFVNSTEGFWGSKEKAEEAFDNLGAISANVDEKKLEDALDNVENGEILSQEKIAEISPNERYIPNIDFQKIGIKLHKSVVRISKIDGIDALFDENKEIDTGVIAYLVSGLNNKISKDILLKKLSKVIKDEKKLEQLEKLMDQPKKYEAAIRTLEILGALTNQRGIELQNLTPEQLEMYAKGHVELYGETNIFEEIDNFTEKLEHEGELSEQGVFAYNKFYATYQFIDKKINELLKTVREYVRKDNGIDSSIKENDAGSIVSKYIGTFGSNYESTKNETLFGIGNKKKSIVEAFEELKPIGTIVDIQEQAEERIKGITGEDDSKFKDYRALQDSYMKDLKEDKKDKATVQAEVPSNVALEIEADFESSLASISDMEPDMFADMFSDMAEEIVFEEPTFETEKVVQEEETHEVAGDDRTAQGEKETQILEEEAEELTEKEVKGIQVEDINVDETLTNTMNNENLPKKITWVDKVRASVDAFGKNVKKAFGSFISAITGKGGENNSGANNSTSSTSSNAGQNKPVQEVNNFVPTVELNLKQAQQATKAAEEAKKNNDARGTDEPTQDDSEIGE